MTLEEWTEAYNRILSCRDDLQKNRFAAELALADGTIGAFVDGIMREHKAEDLRQVLAQTINYRSEDLRLTERSLKWASEVKPFTHFDNSDRFFPELIVDMRPGILNAVTASLMERENSLEIGKRHVKGRRL